MSRLKEVRQKIGISQEELSRRSNVSQSLISQFENEKKGISVNKLKALARGLADFAKERGEEKYANIHVAQLIDKEEGFNLELKELLDVVEEKLDIESMNEFKRRRLKHLLGMLRMEMSEEEALDPPDGSRSAVS